LIDLKTRAVAPFFPDALTFHNIYKLQKHVLLRHQSYLSQIICLQGNNKSMKGEEWYDKLFNLKYLPLFHHFKAIYQLNLVQMDIDFIIKYFYFSYIEIT
jgi:hypothetical protein